MTSTGTPSVLFVFAHQDDELPVLARIRYERALGVQVRCVYLTDGARDVPAEVRDAESLSMLSRVGVDPTDVTFLGGARRISDGRLAFETAAAMELLRSYARTISPPERIYTLDWEGGHPDHDACHALALVLARELRVPDVLAYSLYNGFGRRPGWFRVTSFVPGGGKIVRRRLSLPEVLLSIRALAHYRSQRRTWLGLGPGLVLRMLINREERFRHAEAARLGLAPHEGTLLYESMFGISARSVLDATAELRAELIRTS
jgi:LmbE family N-acetylglucosaminyl deacetylase